MNLISHSVLILLPEKSVCTLLRSAIITMLCASAIMFAGCSYSQVHAPNGQLLERRFALLYNPEKSRITMDVSGDISDIIGLIPRTPGPWYNMHDNSTGPLELRTSTSTHRIDTPNPQTGEWRYRYEFTP